jgi:hypothetical protein
VKLLEDTDGLESGIDAGRRTYPDAASSILAALAYSDLFDYPLTADEITRYQVGTTYTAREILEALRTDPALRERIVSSGKYFALCGRGAVFATRAQRSADARKIWKRARIYSRWLTHLPYVRMVAVTGALAVDNIAERPDIDLLVIARPGRVWICRRSIIALVRIARLLGDELCPNYILADNSLDLDQRDFFTAHELAQMVPMYGSSVYTRMLRANSWAQRYLPQAFVDPLRRSKTQPLGPVRAVAERLLGSHLFDGWERWELSRLQSKLRPLVGDAAEVICSPTQCKGHTGLHRQSITDRYRARLQELGLYDTFAHLLDDAAAG